MPNFPFVKHKNVQILFKCHPLSFLFNSVIFLSAGICSVLYSNLSASLFDISELTPAGSTGLRDLVYKVLSLFEPTDHIFPSNGNKV